MSILNIKKLLKNLKLHESTISMVLGAIVIIVTGVLIINYFDGKRGETITSIETENTLSLPATHTITEGEDLWKIAEKYYGSGYNWVDIARENNISNPDQIFIGQELNIPDAQPRIAAGAITPIPDPEITIPDIAFEKEIQESGNVMHVVESGENLWKIAENYYNSGYNWVDIANANELSENDSIEVGQEIIIPNVEPKLVTSPQLDKETIEDETYTVVKDDSLWDIAERAYGDGYRWVDIAKENNLVNPNIIHPGNTLTLPR